MKVFFITVDILQLLLSLAALVAISLYISSEDILVMYFENTPGAGSSSTFAWTSVSILYLVLTLLTIIIHTVKLFISNHASLRPFMSHRSTLLKRNMHLLFLSLSAIIWIAAFSTAVKYYQICQHRLEKLTSYLLERFTPQLVKASLSKYPLSNATTSIDAGLACILCGVLLVVVYLVQIGVAMSGRMKNEQAVSAFMPHAKSRRGDAEKGLPAVPVEKEQRRFQQDRPPVFLERKASHCVADKVKQNNDYIKKQRKPSEDSRETIDWLQARRKGSEDRGDNDWLKMHRNVSAEGGRSFFRPA